MKPNPFLPKQLTLEEQLLDAIRGLKRHDPFAELEAALRPVELKPLPPDCGPTLADLGLDFPND